MAAMDTMTKGPASGPVASCGRPVTAGSGGADRQGRAGLGVGQGRHVADGAQELAAAGSRHKAALLRWFEHRNPAATAALYRAMDAEHRCRERVGRLP